MSEFASIPEHIKDNYRERVAAGEKWLAIHEQAVKDEAHDVAAWAKVEADAVGEKFGKTPKPRKATEPTPAPVEPVVEPTPEPVVEPPTETPAP